MSQKPSFIRLEFESFNEGGFFMEKNHWDVVIIGGGLAGYVAANYLGKTSLNVLLLEKGSKVGGRARTDVSKEQYFNMGPHALYKKGKAKPILDELGVDLSGESPKLSGVVVQENEEYQAPFSPGGLFSTKLLKFQDRFKWINVFTRLNKINADELAGMTYKEWVQEEVEDEMIQQLLFVFARIATYSHAPEKVSAKVVVTHLKRVMGGVLYLDDGWQKMIDQLHNKAVLSGVQVQKKANVIHIESLEVGKQRIKLSNGEEIKTNRIIYTGAPYDLKKISPITDALHNSIKNMEPIKAATLDVALTKLPYSKRKFGMGLSEPFYYSVHSSYGHLSKDGQSAVLHVLKYLHPDEDLDVNQVKGELEMFMEKMQPGWKNYEITSRYLPTMTVNQRVPLPKDDGTFRSARIKGTDMYIAGDWTCDDSMLSEAAISSGKRAAEEILHDEMG